MHSTSSREGTPTAGAATCVAGAANGFESATSAGRVFAGWALTLTLERAAPEEVFTSRSGVLVIPLINQMDACKRKGSYVDLTFVFPRSYGN